MAKPKGESLKVGFNGSLKLEFHWSKVTSDAGFLAYRELDEALGLFNSVPALFLDELTGRNNHHDIASLLRQSIYSRLAGYEDVNDAERLALYPAMRIIAGKRREKIAASANTMGRFETETLTRPENLSFIEQFNSQWVERVMLKTTHRTIILDKDSSESPVYGEQEGSAYNGLFNMRCYHPLFCFNQFGYCEGAPLRPGNVHSADRWRDLLDPIVKRYAAQGLRIYFRCDAAFSNPGALRIS